MAFPALSPYGRTAEVVCRTRAAINITVGQFPRCSCSLEKVLFFGVTQTPMNTKVHESADILINLTPTQPSAGSPTLRMAACTFGSVLSPWWFSRRLEFCGSRRPTADGVIVCLLMYFYVPGQYLTHNEGNLITVTNLSVFCNSHNTKRIRQIKSSILHSDNVEISAPPTCLSLGGRAMSPNYPIYSYRYRRFKVGLVCRELYV